MCLIGDSFIMKNGLSMGFNDGSLLFKKSNLKNTPIVCIIRSVAQASKTSADAIRNLKRYKTVKPFISALTDGTAKGRTNKSISATIL